jgi:hypothetical protein
MLPDCSLLDDGMFEKVSVMLPVGVHKKLFVTLRSNVPEFATVTVPRCGAVKLFVNAIRAASPQYTL